MSPRGTDSSFNQAFSVHHLDLTMMILHALGP
jgi:hypothetical protein